MRKFKYQLINIISVRKINQPQKKKKVSSLFSSTFIYLEILFPDRDVATWDSNDGSIVSKLVYGNTSVLLMGDSTKLTEGIVVSRNDLSGVDILKAGHHGSKTSTGLPLLEESKPSVVVISAGEDNRYGHPDEETIENLNEMNIPYLVTMDEGTITFISDGRLFIRK
mgnify:CR=1 FL=1